MVVCLTGLWRYRNYLVIFLTPLLILPLPIIVGGPEASCGYVIILTALYWCTECMPLAVTGLLPVILFPMMGIMESSEVCTQYMKDSNMLFVGGLLMATAVEHWNLHKRIALRVLLLVGVKPALLMMGFMGTTAFLSMWIGNTASTAMMLPISNAVLKQLCDTEAQAEEREMDLISLRGAGPGTGIPKGQDNQAFDMDDGCTTECTKDVKPMKNGIQLEPEPEVEESPEARERRLKREAKYLKLDKGMSLSVCYAASIGGTATLTGTAPNLILKGQVDELFPGNGDIINFASWFGFSFPNMVLMLIISWLWLQFMYLGCNMKKSFGCGTNKDGDKEAYGVIKNEYKKLGSVSFAEGCILVLFVLLVLLWFTREPGFMPGWAAVLFNKDKPYVTDGTVAMLMSTLFFVIPSQLPRCGGYSEDVSPSKTLHCPLDARMTRGGESMSPTNQLIPDPPRHDGDDDRRAPPEQAGEPTSAEVVTPCQLTFFRLTSGLSQWLGESLAPLQSIPPIAISFLLSLLIATFTECSSNVATTTLFLPILASMAVAIKLHPLYVMLPCTICASLAFMLPVATPPNAIAFSYGNLKVMDMAKAGFVLNIIGVITINIALNTWGTAMFNLNTFPDWANVTTIPTP
ncbi:solute carrier family 13 member 2-like [Oncorhynchus nerka]|uniref:solute carrier family 13 member 2-like n=1 Tax=Oncorhynchus nerka TaxID=8023 RepID=UPI0031B87E36